MNKLCYISRNGYCMYIANFLGIKRNGKPKYAYTQSSENSIICFGVHQGMSLGSDKILYHLPLH